MILEEKVEVKYSGKNIPILKSKGYLDLKQGQLVEVRINDLSIKSSIKVTAICSICDSHTKISYSKYNTNLSRHGYYGCKRCSYLKLEKTSLEKYGTKRPSQSDKVKEAQEATNLFKYGTKSALQNDLVKQKTYNKNIEKFGCVYPLSNMEVYRKRTNTMIDRYGCEFSGQSPELFKKINKVKRRLNEASGLYYESSYELDFIEFCLRNNLPIKRGPTIKYFFDGKKRTYFSDFYLESKNLVIEIKSEYIYNKFYEKNILKMETCKNMGYNFLFIIDKNYKELEKFLYT
jgi:hypothetical protein